MKWLISIVRLLVAITASGLAEGAIQLPRTGQTISFAPGDDGDLRAGMAWPAPRFSSPGDGTTIDRLTGLMWVENANLMVVRDPAFDTDGARDGKVLWTQALNYIAKLNDECFLGHHDWRLPNIRELASLIDHSRANPCLPGDHPFTNVQTAYFSSTSDELLTVWGVRFFDLHSNVRSGSIENLADKRSNPYPVWPVRTAGAGAVQLPQTGQTRSLYPGDDGELRQGAPIPAPRFAELADGTVRDRLTGLMWPKDAGAITGMEGWNSVLTRLAELNASNYLGHNDWRLPNRWEAWSLVDFGQTHPALPPDHPFLIDNSVDFWTATTDASASNDVYYGSTAVGASRASIHARVLGTNLRGSGDHARMATARHRRRR